MARPNNPHRLVLAPKFEQRQAVESMRRKVAKEVAGDVEAFLRGGGKITVLEGLKHGDPHKPCTSFSEELALDAGKEGSIVQAV